MRSTATDTSRLVKMGSPDAYEGMALGCVRVDLTVRLGRGVEGFDSTVACIF